MTWSIKFFLQRHEELRLTKVDMAILDLNITHPDTQAQVLKKIDILYCPAILTACQGVFAKPWSKLPISKVSLNEMRPRSTNFLKLKILRI